MSEGVWQQPFSIFLNFSDLLTGQELRQGLALLAPLMILSGGSELHVTGRIQGSLNRVLHHADDEADATICMATSLEMPNREQAMGISSREPPATPEAPQDPERS